MNALAAHPATARILPFGAFILVLMVRGFIGVADPAAPHVGQADGVVDALSDPRWLYAVQAGVAAALLVVLGRRYVELRGTPASGGSAATGAFGAARLSLPAMGAAVAAGGLIFVLWINLTAPWMRIGEPAASFIPTTPADTLRWDLIVVRLLGAVIVVPLVEEIFWRSWLMRWIDRRDFLSLDPARVSWLARIASSAVFALGHDLWLAGFIAGLVFAQLYRATRTLWAPILAHLVANLALGIHVVGTRTWSLW